MKLSRADFIKLIDDAIAKVAEDRGEDGKLNDEQVEALREVGRTSPECRIGEYGPSFEDWPAKDEPLLFCMCPIRQARLDNLDPAVSEFAEAFDKLADELDVGSAQV